MKVAIIGLGLIGGSLAKALKNYNDNTRQKKYEVLGIVRRRQTLKLALQTKSVDYAYLNLEDCRDADIVVIALPVDLIAPTYKELCAYLKSGAVVTDVGSVKNRICEEILKIQSSKDIKNPPVFVGAHPMSGKETNGLKYAESDLFLNANVVITGSIKKSAKAEKIVEQMWKDAKAKIIKMAPKEHDNLVALTSHLPHLMAFALHKIYNDKKARDRQIEKILAGSFYSAIRVASSSADMWAPIFSYNTQNIIKNLNAFIKELNVLKASLKDKEQIKKQIKKTQIIS
ncbi:MAG: prephenate dehydrogenase/arogenate dehydrogenase family protein [Elusimicrobiota bacterium]|nr:prephenate dehydrogenase/arogenate dehydrogenase family protein [Elusimicrobiota bacterium]